MPAELMRVPLNGLTLYEMEETLALYASAVESVDEDEATQFLQEVGSVVLRVKSKRDAVVAFLRECDAQVGFADQEIERLRKRKERIVDMRTRLETYVVSIIQRFAPADRKGIKRLEGNVSTMRIQKNPDSVLIDSPDAVPPMFKDIVITMPAYVWEALLQRIGLDERQEFESHIRKTEFKPDKKAIGVELKGGNEIPGADLKFGDYRLVIS